MKKGKLSNMLKTSNEMRLKVNLIIETAKNCQINKTLNT